MWVCSEQSMLCDLTVKTSAFIVCGMTCGILVQTALIKLTDVMMRNGDQDRSGSLTKMWLLCEAEHSLVDPEQRAHSHRGS